MNQRLKNNLQLAGIVIVIIILDQITKNMVRENLAFGETWMPVAWLAPYARFINWQNTGAAFGIFQSGNQILKVLTSIIAVVIIIYYQQVPFSQKLVRIAMSMMVGGAIGNLIDRFTQGFVTDFVSVGNFAVFNVADSCVTVGVGLMILAMLLEEVKNKKNGDPAESSEESFIEPQEDSNKL